MKHLPNLLTIARIVLAPLVFYCMWLQTFTGSILALTFFVVAAISDYWDGRFARMHQTGTRLGQFLDPLADKILVLGTFVVLAWLHPRLSPWWAVVLIALRDVGVTLLRSYVESKGRSLRTLPMAKWKTALQLTFLISVLFFLTFDDPIMPAWVRAVSEWMLAGPVLFALLVALVVVTVGTGLLYFVRPEYSR